jgi:hypothetical protein
VHAVQSANDSLLACESFVDKLLDNRDCGNSLIDSAQNENPLVLIKWLEKVLESKPVPVKQEPQVSPGKLFSIPNAIENMDGVVRVLHSQFEIAGYVRELLAFIRLQDDPFLTIKTWRDSVSKVQGSDQTVNALCEIATAIGDFTDTKDEDILFSLVCLIAEDQVCLSDLKSLSDDRIASLSHMLRSHCIIGLILICIILGRFDDGLTALESCPFIQRQHGDKFAEIFDSQSFSSYRCILLTGGGKAFSQLLLAMTMKINQDSTGFKVILGRLHVISIHRSLSC